MDTFRSKGTACRAPTGVTVRARRAVPLRVGLNPSQLSEEVFPDVLERSETVATFLDACGVNLNRQQLLVFSCFGKDRSPGIDDETVSVEADTRC